VTLQAGAFEPPTSPDVVLLEYPAMTTNLPSSGTQIVEDGVNTAYEVYLDSRPR
jgi:hypothetical protein